MCNVIIKPWAELLFTVFNLIGLSEDIYLSCGNPYIMRGLQVEARVVPSLLMPSDTPLGITFNLKPLSSAATKSEGFMPEWANTMLVHPSINANVKTWLL